MRKELNVCSLFDVMSCLQIASNIYEQFLSKISLIQK
jgi:hypothetical protein